MTKEEKLKILEDWYDDQFITKEAKALLENLYDEFSNSEDEKAKECIVNLLLYLREDNPQYADACNDSIAWIKALDGEKKHTVNKAEPAKNQIKPIVCPRCLKSAWSDDDDDHVESLLKRLQGICRNESVQTRFAISEDCDWLKSLRKKK